jgi:L-aminopeptidase/D-esterase-like protein
MSDDKHTFSVPGFRVGHWTHPSGSTGCTAVIADESSLAVVDVRGGAPGTRETSLLEEGRMVQRVDAVLLTGGSAFGLAAADGVVRRLREQGRGFPTGSIPVPIVSAAVLFDLHGKNPVWPDAAAGYEAAASASESGWISGRLGAGAGATVAKALSRDGRPSGLGAAKVTCPAGTVAALLAVNAVGEIASTSDGHAQSMEEIIMAGGQTQARAGENTTIGVIVVDAAVSRDDLVRIGVAAHDGLARSIHPAHTQFDGDTIFVLGRREGKLEPAHSLQLTVATQHAVMQAVFRSAADARQE